VAVFNDGLRAPCEQPPCGLTLVPMLADRLLRRARSLDAIDETELAAECRLLASILKTHRAAPDAAKAREVAAWLQSRSESWEERGMVEMAGACVVVADILVSRSNR
jgi:hypothetical protein